MSTAPLQFRPLEPDHPLDPAILQHAWDEFPGPLAITENGELLHANSTFNQLANSRAAGAGLLANNAGPDWERKVFICGSRILTLHTLHNASSPESQYLSLIGRLVGSVAHDFNNLLTGILLYCDLLGANVVPPQQFTQKIEEIRAAAEKGAGLIRQLMTIGREDNDSPRFISFPEALQDVLPLLRHLVGENIRIHAAFESESGIVPITLAQAQQIVLNLVLNSRDAMPQGGSIAIETNSRRPEHNEAEGRIFELTVSDSGTGMDAQTAASIFEPFFTTKARSRGTGMGLATVRRIVENAGGRMEVDSAPGRGTRMTVQLPEIEPGTGNFSNNGGPNPLLGRSHSESEGDSL